MNGCARFVWLSRRSCNENESATKSPELNDDQAIVEAALFGGQQAMLLKIVYILVGLSALYQLVPFSKALSIGEPMAEGRVVR
jgi:hypothetical protein